jgi:hypothetical protein
VVIGLQSTGGMNDDLRIRTFSNRGSGRSVRSINLEQLATPTDRILVLGGLRKLDDQRRHRAAPAPDIERTEVVRHDLVSGRTLAVAAVTAVLGVVFAIASLIAAGAAPT